MTRTVTNVSTAVTVDLIDVVTITAGPIVATTTGIDTIIVATTAVITDVMTIVATIATTGVMTERVIAVTTNTITAEMIGMMTIAARMTTTVTAAIARNYHHHHHLKGTTLTVCFNQPTERSTSVGGRQATKSNKQL
jgi:Na+-transporting methylmalonyl-CoA/oxaloacetate decarboxylase beta subunit